MTCGTPTAPGIVSPMFLVTEADAAAICTAMQDGGELAAVAEARKRFPALVDAHQVHRFALTVAEWTPLPIQDRHAPSRARP